MIESRVQRLMEAIADEVTVEIRKKFETLRGEGDRRLESAAERIKSEAMSRIGQLIEDIKEKKEEQIAIARREASKDSLLDRKELMDEVYKRLELEIVKLRMDPRYPDALQRYIIEGIQALGENDVELVISRDDIDLFTQEFLRESEAKVEEELGMKIHLTLTVDDNIDIIGGLMVRDKKTGIMYNNTLRRRLERMRKQVNVYIDNVLFKSNSLSS